MSRFPLQADDEHVDEVDALNFVSLLQETRLVSDTSSLTSCRLLIHFVATEQLFGPLQ